MAKKALLGHKIRRLRRDQGLTQARMAEHLGISASYLNLLENNQRPVTVSLLLRLGQSFNVDLQAFAEDEGARLVSAMQEVFSDALFERHKVNRDDMVQLASTVPEAARGIMALYQAYRETREDLRLLMAEAAGQPAGPSVGGSTAAIEAVRDYVHEQGNFFPELEAAAEEVWQRGNLNPNQLDQSLIDYLERSLATRVRLMPLDTMGAVRRRYDRHSRRLLLSEILGRPSRTFQLAVQIALIQFRDLLDHRVKEAGFGSDEAGRVMRMDLANYVAGAITMPYDRIHRAVTHLRYDIELLQHRFGASFEQICHRLTTLQRPGAKGVPFFMIRMDKAGNVSKRYGANRGPFARVGGACPRWNVHDAFRWPGRIHTQLSEMTDGQRYFSLAAMVVKAGAGYRAPGQVFAIALGCDAAHASELVYADGVDLYNSDIAVPIGVHCRLCTRLDCSQRAFPPLNHRLTINEDFRGVTAYAFEPQ